MLKAEEANRCWVMKIAEYIFLPQRTPRICSILSSRRHFNDKFLQSINKFVNLHLGTTQNQDVLSAQGFYLWLAHQCFCTTILPSWIVVAIGSVISTDVSRRTAWLCPSHFTWFPVWWYVIQRCEMQAVSLTTLLCSATCRGLTAPTRVTPPFRFTERRRQNKLKDAWTLWGSAQLTCQGTSSI
jgi:hypothetical protein